MLSAPTSSGPAVGTVTPPVRTHTTPTPVGSPHTTTPTPATTTPTPETGGYKPIPGRIKTPRPAKVEAPAQPVLVETPAPATTPAPETGGTKSRVKPDRINTLPPSVPTEPVAETGGIKSPVIQEPVVTQPEMPDAAPGKRPKTVKHVSVEPASEAEAPKSPVLVFAKTRCLGNCPTFIATFWADGRVTYTGQENVPKIGTFQLQLPADVITAILKEAEQMGFAGLQAQYTSNTSDLPSTILTIHQPDGSVKTVRAEDDVPGELQNLIARIDTELAKVVGGPASH
ncbi:DUF6438 domain-containing protein [Hymenobacter sp. BT175]|uniref:DUF6438 domain-containing protein n=1 Tax=Hymenobacter translucens TaxID=2886507 RepID=UPI001D0ED956|nr:DUF6438 domain-containing protein [Hymenobacter translucens]MCC2547649.1 DUF6438 domain-containing protein [Hymenobacter translucens]